MMKIKKNRILKILGISAFGIAPIVLASCSSYSTLLARTVSKGDGTNLDSNISLSGYSEAALKSDTGMKAYIKDISENLIYDWLKRLSDTSNNVTLSNDFKNQKITIDDDYDDLVDSYKSKYGSAWQLKFQQEVLDPAGGTVQSYKQSKWNDWVTSQFETQLFNKSYLTYKDSSGKVVSQDSLANASVNDLYTALQGENFVFASSESSTDSNVLTNEKIDNLYADFMQYIWDQYVQINTPYIVNMVLWKYGTPSQGLGNYYTYATSTTTSSDSSSDSNSSSSTSTTTNSSITQVSTSTHDDSSSDSSDSSTTTATAGSYIYPYFSNSSVGSSEGSLTKYVNFLSGANSATSTTVNVSNIGSSSATSQADSNNTQKIPYKATYDSNGYGLTDIPTTLTDDSSTYILAKNSSIYSDLYIEFAAASSYLFWRNSNVTDNVNLAYSSSSTATAADSSSSNYGIPSIDSNIQHNIWSGTTTATNDTDASSSSLPTIDGDTTTGLDPITSSFLSKSDIFSNGGSQYELKLDKSYVNEILKENGNLNSLRNNDLYVIDSFIPKNYNLTNYIFLRDSAGVHAITIDGYNYINGSTEIGKSSLTTTEKKKRAGQVVLFRSLYNNINSKENGYSFSVDVESELKTFYENNIDWLIYSYALSKESESGFKLFDLSNLNLSSQEKAAATAINNFLHETANYTKVDDYNDALYKAKATYSANYGVTAYSNGLAAPWTYATFSDTDATTYDSNPTISFQIATTSAVVKNPFTTSATSTTSTTEYNYDGSTYINKTDLYTSITTLTATLTALANSSFDGFRYSQYIYSNSMHVNAALLAFSSEGTDLADLAKIGLLNKYIGDKFNFSTMKFSGVSVNNQDISTYLNYGMSNFFFNSTFDSATNKWGKLSSTDNKNWSDAISTSVSSSSTSTDLTQIVEDYKIKLWKRANEVYTSTAITNYLSLYTTVASILYMLENNSSYFLNYLTTQINVGDTAYIAWESSQNIALEKDSKSSSATALLSTTNTSSSTQTNGSSSSKQILKRNINNSFVSSYIGGYSLYYKSSSNAVKESTETASNPLTISYYSSLPNSSWSSTSGPNLGDASLYQDTSDAKTYYSISGGMVGFLGLQTSGSNSFNSTVSNLLFTNPTVDNNKGLLYGYESLDNLKSIIQGATSLTEINSIASTLGTNLNQKTISIISTDTDLTLAEKKTKLLTAVENLSGTINNTSTYFAARNGIVNSNSTSEFNSNGLLSSSTSTNMQYAAYTIQLNRSNLTSETNLLTAINTGLSASSSSASSKDNTISTNAYDVFSNLLVQQAVNTTNQSSILSLIIDKQGKITAYDVRLYTGLGAEWIYDWKVTNTSSTSSSSSSDSSSSS